MHSALKRGTLRASAVAPSLGSFLPLAWRLYPPCSSEADTTTAGRSVGCFRSAIARERRMGPAKWGYWERGTKVVILRAAILA